MVLTYILFFLCQDAFEKYTKEGSNTPTYLGISSCITEGKEIWRNLPVDVNQIIWEISS